MAGRIRFRRWRSKGRWWWGRWGRGGIWRGEWRRCVIWKCQLNLHFGHICEGEHYLVLNSSPRHHITGYSAMIPVRSERICSMQSALKCARREFKLYLFTEVYCHTRPCVKTLRSVNPWMKVPKWSKLQRIYPGKSGSREQWTLCRDNVNRNAVHAQSAFLTSRGVLGLELRTAGLHYSDSPL